jgi:hypothetical protein
LSLPQVMSFVEWPQVMSFVEWLQVMSRVEWPQVMSFVEWLQVMSFVEWSKRHRFNRHPSQNSQSPPHMVGGASSTTLPAGSRK